MPCRQLGSYSLRKQVWTYSVLVENKFGLFQVNEQDDTFSSQRPIECDRTFLVTCDRAIY